MKSSIPPRGFFASDAAHTGTFALIVICETPGGMGQAAFLAITGTASALDSLLPDQADRRFRRPGCG